MPILTHLSHLFHGRICYLPPNRLPLLWMVCTVTVAYKDFLAVHLPPAPAPAPPPPPLYLPSSSLPYVPLNLIHLSFDVFPAAALPMHPIHPLLLLAEIRSRINATWYNHQINAYQPSTQSGRALNKHHVT